MDWQRRTKYFVIHRDKIVRAARACILSSYGYSSVLSPEVDESMIQLPTLLLVVGAVSLPLKCEFLVVASWSLLHCLTEYL